MYQHKRITFDCVEIQPEVITDSLKPFLAHLQLSKKAVELLGSNRFGPVLSSYRCWHCFPKLGLQKQYLYRKLWFKHNIEKRLPRQATDKLLMHLPCPIMWPG